MKRLLSLLLCVIITLGIMPSVIAADIDTTANYILESIKDPIVASVGGDWAVLGLARGGKADGAYFAKYYENVKAYVKEKDGVLHSRKYTEYSRVVISLTAIGKDATNVGGYDLTKPLLDFEKTVWQGVNGAIFALIALDSGDYECGIRNKYVDHILKKQLADGGWALSGESADSDVTAMALQALAKYTDRKDVNAAVEKALELMSQKQLANGGFTTQGKETAESAAQMVVALTELGIPFDDSRFVKNGKTVLDAMLDFRLANGGFKHTKEQTGADGMATEQCFYALVAAERASRGKSSLYRMSDAKDITLHGGSQKHPDVQVKPVAIKKTFSDIANHKNRNAIEALASRKIINGKTDTLFYPNATMTRAEFATIVVNALGLPHKSGGSFKDVKKSDWFYSCVNTAYSYGIIKGVSATEFNPHGTLTREEAAVMVTRTAKLCGLDTEYSAFNARNVLAGFSDYVKAADWALSALAFCYDNGILDDSVLMINPKQSVTRAEVADMLYNVLIFAKLV